MWARRTPGEGVPGSRRQVRALQIHLVQGQQEALWPSVLRGEGLGGLGVGGGVSENIGHLVGHGKDFVSCSL